MPPKMGKLIVADLKKRSEKGLKFAKQELQSEKIEYRKLREALEHYIAYWDEFVHPGFFSIGCEAVGGHPDDAVPTQAAIAIMAAAFDVHDDIIDKSEIKHKVPTVYGKFGSEMALLLGDAFLIKGFKLFVNSMTTLPKKKAKIALETMNKMLFEVGNAHALEVGMKAKEKFTANEYLKITKMKAASVEADMYLGALVGGGEDAEVEALSKIGRTLGILATLRDDLIDVFDIEELNQRIAVNDLPLPLIFAIQNHDAEEKLKKI
ncbi:MAG: polyprenyl synthetase family protein, partial [Candidatus Bathyarchaeia archaeon]|nr:polyprenyl synthetase family protein [Candidatus Bathyarchaeia archaeon]